MVFKMGKNRSEKKGRQGQTVLNTYQFVNTL